jgi:hypothetical protein
MRRLWQGIVRTVFWSYDRGSWPYDVMVIVIVLFVVATPRSWFRDQPRAAAAPDASLQVIAQDASAGTQTYRIDAKWLPPEKRAAKPTPELERETHDILGRAVADLKGHTFQVLAIQPVRADDGSVLYYDVTIHW